MLAALKPDIDARDFAALFSFRKKQDRFTERLCETWSADEATTFSSARAGLYHILRAHGIEGKYVLMSAYTCAVVAEAVVQSGNTPVFIDVASQSYSSVVTEEKIAEYGDALGAVIVTDMYGLGDHTENVFFTQARSYLTIFDCSLAAHSIADRAQGEYDYVLISCNVRKPFTCLGGGVVLADSEYGRRLRAHVDCTRQKRQWYEALSLFMFSALLFLVFHRWVYWCVVVVKRKTPWLRGFYNEASHDPTILPRTYSYDMASFQKRIGMVQLVKQPRQKKKREELAEAYVRRLSRVCPEGARALRLKRALSHMPVWHTKRNDLVVYLYQKGIDVECYFDYCIATLPPYTHDKVYHEAERLAQGVLNLPLHCDMTAADVERVVQAIELFNDEQSGKE